MIRTASRAEVNLPVLNDPNQGCYAKFQDAIRRIADISGTWRLRIWSVYESFFVGESVEASEIELDRKEKEVQLALLLFSECQPRLPENRDFLVQRYVQFPSEKEWLRMRYNDSE